jgi:hypothetical protein
VQWEALSLETRGRFLRSGESFVQALPRQQEQRLAPERARAGPEVAAGAVFMQLPLELVGAVELTEPD